MHKRVNIEAILYYSHQTCWETRSELFHNMIIMWCDKGSTTTMTIILPYTNVANQHVVPLKLMQCYVRYISEKKLKIDYSESQTWRMEQEVINTWEMIMTKPH